MDHGRADGRQPSLQSEVEPAQPDRISGVVDAVEGVDARDPRPARGEPPIEAGALAVRMHELDPALADEPTHSHERTERQPIGRDVHESAAGIAEPSGIRALWSRHREVELVTRQTSGEVEDVRGPSAGIRGDEQLEHAQRLSHPASGGASA